MARPRSPYSAPTQTLGTPNSTQRRAGLNTTVMKPKTTGSVVTPQYAPQAAPATPYSPRSNRAPSSYGEFQAAPQMHAPHAASGAMDAPAFQPHDIQPYPQQSAPSMGAPRPAPSRLPLNNFTPARVTGPYGDTSQMGPAGNGIYGQPRQPIPVSKSGQFSAPPRPPAEMQTVTRYSNDAPPGSPQSAQTFTRPFPDDNYGLPDNMAASLRQQAGTFAPTASPANPGTVPLGSYGGANSYNTPNVNTYVAPGGRFASGLGENTPGLAGQIQSHQHQQMLNGLSPSDAKQLRLGGARPEQPFSVTAPPTLDSSSSFATPRGVNFNPSTGSTYFRNGRGSGIIGANATAALEAQGIRQADLAGANFNPEVRNALRNVAQASESRLAAERTAAGGGLSLAGKYRQSQRDVLARRGMMRNPTAPLGANAQSLVNRQADVARSRQMANGQSDTHQQLYNAALKAHLATMTPQQQMAFLQQQVGGSQAAPPVASPNSAPPSLGSTFSSAVLPPAWTAPGKPLVPLMPNSPYSSRGVMGP